MTLAFYLSGGTGNNLPTGSLGGPRSNTQVTSAVLDNLFNDITRQQALVGQTDYRCLYVYNNGATVETNIQITLIFPTITTIQVGLDPAGQGDGQNNGIAQIIATPLTTPSNVTFYGSTNNVLSLTVGTLKAGQGYAIWFSRVSQSGVSGLATFTLSATSSGGTLPTGCAPYGNDGLGTGEIITFTQQGTGTFKIGTARIGFADMA